MSGSRRPIGFAPQLFTSGRKFLSSAQLVDLANTPIEIVPAPGANQTIVPVQVISTLTFGTVQYPNITPSLLYGEDEGQQCEFAPFDGSNSNHDSFGFQVIGGSGAYTFSKVGSAGFALNLKVMNGDPTAGPIVTSTLDVGGSGYAPGDTFILIGVDNASSHGTVDTVDGDGAVVTYTITNPGTNYSSPTTSTTVAQGGSGGDNNLTINITAVQPGDGTGTIEVLYRLITWA